MTTFQEVLEENNGIIRDWGRNKKGEFLIIADSLEEAKEVLAPYADKFDYCVSHDAYAKCDICFKIIPIEDTYIDDGDCICEDCEL